MNSKKQILWDSTVGSHMWSMQHKYSDIDIFQCYILDTPSILLGKSPKGKQTQGAVDITSYELGHVVSQLQKGNINFLWGITSPIYTGWGDGWGSVLRTKLNNIVRENMSKNYYWSIKGLSEHNLHKYFGVLVEDGEYKLGIPKIDPNSEKGIKKLKLIQRTLLFGINLLNHEIVFIKPEKITLDSVIDTLYTLHRLYEICDLPETPPEELFEEFLIEARMSMLWRF